MSEEFCQNSTPSEEAQIVRKPVVIAIRSRKGKGHQIRHWVVLCVSEMEGGVAFAPLATDVSNALDMADELTPGGVSWRASGAYTIAEHPHAYVLTIMQDPAEQEILVPLIWRGHPVRLITMDSPTDVTADVVLGRYRGRMSKELRLYRGDLSEEVVL